MMTHAEKNIQNKKEQIRAGKESSKLDIMAECEENEDANFFLNADSEPLNLSDMLDSGWKILEEIDVTKEPLGSKDIQGRIQLALRMLEEASRSVARLDLLNHGEELEEVATTDLKYLLLPALLGALTLKQTRMDNRLEILQAAQAYFMDFLMRCKDYNMWPFELPKLMNESQLSPERASQNGFSTCVRAHCSSDLVSMAAQRQAKIERYRTRNQLESRLSDIQRAVQSGRADEEAVRDFYLLSFKRWIAVCLEETESIALEMEMLRMMDGAFQACARPLAQPARPPVESFTLTRADVQAQVFGTGYPSLPTMTVCDWYEQHSKEEHSHDLGIMFNAPVDMGSDLMQRQEVIKTDDEDDDDTSQLRARSWDDWKDIHPKGYGNRQNMG